MRSERRWLSDKGDAMTCMVRLAGILAALTLAVGFVGEARGGLIYWTQDGSVYRANQDGSNAGLVVQGSLTNGYDIRFIAIDPLSQMLYQYGRVGSTGNWQGFVRRSGLDGSSPQDLLVGGVLPESITYGFLLDYQNDKMYM